MELDFTRAGPIKEWSMRKEERRRLKRSGGGRFLAMLCTALGLILVAGCASREPSETVFSPVEYDEAYELGREIKFSHDGAYLARTSGDSMEPVLSENSLVVVRPIDFGDLERGMIVGYRNSDGHRVLHKLIRKAGSEAWIAKGIGNRRPDPDRVTRRNLLGALYTTLYNESSELPSN